MTDSHHVVCPGCGTVNRIAADRPAGAARCGTCHVPLFTAHPLEVDEAGLERHVRLNTIPLLLDVWAPWCGPCRQMGPAFERAAASLEPDMRLLKLNADQAQNTCAKLGVRGIPAMFLYQNGVVIGGTAGAMDANSITRWARAQLMSHAN